MTLTGQPSPSFSPSSASNSPRLSARHSTPRQKTRQRHEKLFFKYDCRGAFLNAHPQSRPLRPPPSARLCCSFVSGRKATTDRRT